MTNWGENGFIRLKRGVNMCGIGRSITTVSCQKVGGPTDAPLTTVKPCNDNFGNCADMARTACYQPHIAEGCPVSCGLCPGMTPARSYTCYNKFSNCNSMAAYCNQQNIKDNCKITLEPVNQLVLLLMKHCLMLNYIFIIDIKVTEF